MNLNLMAKFATIPSKYYHILRGLSLMGFNGHNNLKVDHIRLMTNSVQLFDWLN